MVFLAFMVHLNRLVIKKQLNIVFWNGVRQSKESREPKTCAGEVRRLCDSNIRTRIQHVRGVLRHFNYQIQGKHIGYLYYILLQNTPSRIRLSRELRAQSFAGKTHPPEEFSTRLLLRIPFGKNKKKNTTQGGVTVAFL